jgi:hypothetical protein
MLDKTKAIEVEKQPRKSEREQLAKLKAKYDS